ncbi:MAG TPA: CDP-glucose 4,6-dehydratase [Edaphocola sp.]|nr:CDP-glucose 4,6-dehydratase [Edaphocola sp.]
MVLPDFFKGKKIFLTGHTGFKGSWLLHMLYLLGSEVKGYALAPGNSTDLYYQMNGDEMCYTSVIADIRDQHSLMGEIVRFEPDIIFHLAAQPLVRKSYDEPVDTFETNVMGTVHVLEAMRGLTNPCAAIMITTDKVYENPENGKAFIESDKLGGYDPYSSSKAAAEIAIASYRKSYFPPQAFPMHQKSVIALRAGNVIGGGDYSDDRIIPDIYRAIINEETVKLRNPGAIRPWQHVLEPLGVYLEVAQTLLTNDPDKLLPAYNIGPDAKDMLTVETVTRKFIRYYGAGNYEVAEDAKRLHEAGTLLLDNSALQNDLGWQPKYHADEAIRLTAEWYANKEQSASEKMRQQIISFFS